MTIYMGVRKDASLVPQLRLELSELLRNELSAAPSEADLNGAKYKIFRQTDGREVGLFETDQGYLIAFGGEKFYYPGNGRFDLLGGFNAFEIDKEGEFRDRNTPVNEVYQQILAWTRIALAWNPIEWKDSEKLPASLLMFS